MLFTITQAIEKQAKKSVTIIKYTISNHLS